MYHIIGNMHIHTPYSDGEKYHDEVALAAINAGLDFIIVTDHNIWLGNLEKVVIKGLKKLLMLIGEEVHDTDRKPESNHLLVYGPEKEVASFATDPQQLIDEINQQGGFCFLAHPDCYALSLFGGVSDLGWHSWEVQGFAGLEIWNYMSSFTNEVGRWVGTDVADNLLNRARALPIALAPERFITAPEQRTLDRWDFMLARGQRVSAIGNSDVHGTPMRLGPIAREIFPYEFCFRAVNTHLLIPEPLNHEIAHDKALIYRAMKQGNGWIGYDMPHPTQGFIFEAYGKAKATIGEQILLDQLHEFVIQTPAPCHIRLIRHGQLVASIKEGMALRYRPTQSGAYRVECQLPYKGKMRGWIYSNPIYVSDQ